MSDIIEPKKDKHWLFQKGNKLAVNHGRPYAKESAQLKKALHDSISYHDMCVMWKKFAWKAKRGDARSFQIILERLFGKAVATVEISAAEGNQEIQSLSTEELMRMVMDMKVENNN